MSTHPSKSTHPSNTTHCTCGASREGTAREVVDDLRPRASPEMSDPDLEPMLTMDEVCELLRTSKSTIYSMRSEGRGPVGVKIGRRVLFRPSDIRRFCERNESGNRS
ncbi:helix-turn-helix transcriptional regulator [Curtobacterium sp. 20TX0008]|uniref:helix-turn-helix transcriptional regulator n=1 Tax=Curtobacterium sp. 20TX0008 TaxID=3022018 RepID=UPI00232BCE99|nr:helix-turn-helix domain-containing protein [Curtobacterium sp. 20TX0008]MDB6425848.1 helix-turn-helix domain-containing protein [Curtobacterium sp. 20TX0008]